MDRRKDRWMEGLKKNDRNGSRRKCLPRTGSRLTSAIELSSVITIS